MKSLGYTHVDCRVDLDDVLSNLTNEQLMECLVGRKVNVTEPEDSFKRLVSEAYDYLSDGNAPMAMLRIEQALFPRFKNLNECLVAYGKVKAEANSNG